MKSMFGKKFKSFFALLTILSVTFTQACPAFALRNMGPDSAPVAAAIKAGLEEPDFDGATAVVANRPLDELREPAFWTTSYDSERTGGPVESSTFIPGQPGGVYVVRGVTAAPAVLGTGETTGAGMTVAAFSSPLTISADQVYRVEQIVARGKQESSALDASDQLIYDQVRQKARRSPNALVEDLQSSARRGQDYWAAVAVAALKEIGCFCGHYSYPGSLDPNHVPIHGVETIGVENLTPLFDLIEGHRLQDELNGPGRLFVSDPDDVQVPPTSARVRFQEYQDGKFVRKTDWIEIGTQGAEGTALQAYRDQQARIVQLQKEHQKLRKPGSKDRLDKARSELVLRRRVLLNETIRRIEDSSVRYKNYLLEDLYAADQDLRQIQDFAKGFTRFRDFQRVVQDPALRKGLKEFVAQLNKLTKEEAEQIHQTRERHVLTSSQDLYAMRLRLRLLQKIAWTIEREVLARIEEVQNLIRDPKVKETKPTEDEIEGSTLRRITNEGLSQVSEEVLHEAYGLNLVFRGMNRRMETRGRDSLGLQMTFSFKDAAVFETFQKGLTKQEREALGARSKRQDLVNGHVEVRYGADKDGKKDLKKPVTLTLTYKTASLVGSLGDNVRVLTYGKRLAAGQQAQAAVAEAITNDPIYQKAIRQAQSIKLAHTRWASAGEISEPNAHPVDNKGRVTISTRHILDEEMAMEISSNRIHSRYGTNGQISVVFNGDVINYDRPVSAGTRYSQNLLKQYRTRPLPPGVSRVISKRIKTDAKLLALTIEEYLARGYDLENSVRLAATRFAGSFSMQVQSNLEPNLTITALGGEGQGLYVGLSPDSFIPASDQSFIDVTDRFVRVKPGQMVVIDNRLSPTLKNLKRVDFKTGEPVPYSEDDIEITEQTTQDIDLGENAFFFVKEVFEAGPMFEATIEGRIGLTAAGGRDSAWIRLDEEQLSPKIREMLVAHRRLKEIEQALADDAGRIDRDPQRLSEADRLALVRERRFLKGDSDQVVKINRELKGLYDKLDKLKDVHAKQTVQEDIDRLVVEREKVRPRAVNRIVVAGMGTANAAGMVGANFIKRYLRKAGYTGEVVSEVATDAAKFDVPWDQTDTLIFAISQSGSTADSNEYLKKVVKRGATVVGVINKRDSESVFIARDSGGSVFYTGAGWETEIAVASTKAYYAQIGALAVLGMGMAMEMGVNPQDEELVADTKELLDTPRKINEFLAGVPRGVPSVAEAAASPEKAELRRQLLETPHPIVAAARFWPLRRGKSEVIGDGPARLSAEEARIKLSELNFWAVVPDFLTHPKHINLSAHPLLIILAANIKGEDGGWFRDYLLNQIDNFLSHSSPVIAVTTKEEADIYLRDKTKDRNPVKSFKWMDSRGIEHTRPVDIIEVPPTLESFSPIYAAMASHLLGYHTALAIRDISFIMGQALNEVTEAWESRISKGITPDRIVQDKEFNSLVEKSFKPFLGLFQEEGLKRQGDLDQFWDDFKDMYSVLIGEKRFEETRSYGPDGARRPFFEVFKIVSEVIRSEFNRGIDAIRDQAKFVSVGIVAEGAVVVEDLEKVAAAAETQNVPAEAIETLLESFVQFRTIKKPQTALLPDPFDAGAYSLFVVLDQNTAGLTEDASGALAAAGGSIEEHKDIPLQDGLIAQIYKIQKPVDQFALTTAGMEEKPVFAVVDDFLNRRIVRGLNVVGQVGNWLVTENGAMIGKPGTSIGVNLANIHPSAVLEPGVRLTGPETVVEAGAVIGKGSYLENSKVRQNARVGAGSVLIYRWKNPKKDLAYWRLSPEESPYIAGSVPTEIGENAQIGEGTYLYNFAVGRDSVWARFETYPNIGIHGQMGERVHATTAKIVLAKIGDDSEIGNFAGKFEEGTVTGPLEVTDFVGRPGQKLGQAGRSADYYVEYWEGFSLPPLIVEDIQPNGDRRLRALDFMGTPVVLGNQGIPLEFSGTVQPPKEKQITQITGKEESVHGILSFGFGGVLGAGSKMIGVPDGWTRDGVATPADIYSRSSRTYLGHFAFLAPPGFRYISASPREDTVAEGEGWARFGNFSLRGGLTVRSEVPAWVLEHAVDLILTQMADEFLRLRDLKNNKPLGDPKNLGEFNAFIQNAIQSELMELRAERVRLEREDVQVRAAPRRDEERVKQVAQRLAIVAEGIHQIEKHAQSGAWHGEWRIREEDGRPAFGSWWKEGDRWVNHDQNYTGSSEQFTLAQLVAPVPGEEHPRQEWTPPLTSGDWNAILSLFAKPGKRSVQATVDGIVHPSAVIEEGAKIEEGAVIGPGAVVKGGAVVKAGAFVAYSQVGAGAVVEEKARLYGVVMAPGAVAKRESHLRLSLLGSEGEREKAGSSSSVGKDTVVTLSKVMDGSIVGEDNTLIGSMVLKGFHGKRASHLGNDNEVIFGRLESVDAGSRNNLNGQIHNASIGNNARVDHLSTVLKHEIIEPVVIRLADNRSANLYPPTTHGAYVAVQGTDGQPVRIAGSFLGGLTVVQPGARLDRSFAKGSVAPNQNLFFSFSTGPDLENTELAGVLSRNKPQFIFRFMLSYPLKGTPKADVARSIPATRWAVGYLVEDAAEKTVPQMVEGLVSAGASLTAQARTAIDRLLQITGTADIERGPASAAVRAERAPLVQQILAEVDERLSHEPPEPERYTRTKQLLLGLRNSVEALDGRWRLRIDATEDVLQFTEGVWEYKYAIDPETRRETGRYVWVPAKEIPVLLVGVATAPTPPVISWAPSAVPLMDFNAAVTAMLEVEKLPVTGVIVEGARAAHEAYLSTRGEPQVEVFPHPSGDSNKAVLVAVSRDRVGMLNDVIGPVSDEDGMGANLQTTGAQTIGDAAFVILNIGDIGPKGFSAFEAVKSKIRSLLSTPTVPDSFRRRLQPFDAQMEGTSVRSMYAAYKNLQGLKTPNYVIRSRYVPNRTVQSALTIIVRDEERFRSLDAVAREVIWRNQLQIVSSKGAEMAFNVDYLEEPGQQRVLILRYVINAPRDDLRVVEAWTNLKEQVGGDVTPVTSEIQDILQPHRGVVDSLIREYETNQKVEFRLLPGSTSDQTIVAISGRSQTPGILGILTGTMAQADISLSDVGIYNAGGVGIAYVVVNVSGNELRKRHAQDDEKLPGISVENVLASRIAAHFPTPEQFEFQNWLSRQNRTETEIAWLTSLYHYYHGFPRVAVEEVPESEGGEMAVVGLTPYASLKSVSEPDFARAVEARIQSLANEAGIPPVQNATPLTTFVREYEFPHPMVVVQLTFQMSRSRLFDLGIAEAVEDVLTQLSAPSAVSSAGLEEVDLTDLRDRILPESSTSVTSGVSIIAGPHVSALALGAAISKVTTSDGQAAAQVVFVVENEAEAERVNQLATPLMVFAASDPQYGSVEAALAAARDFMKGAQELGTNNRPVPESIQLILQRLFGIELGGASVPVWQSYVDRVTGVLSGQA